ncbi:MAG: sigma-70 family RNA polymerase sigma factor [Phycisphaerae bacterium]|nr:sigma-70 family RNA polymerase sigma factor [Phycisphaerae bacterium]
MDRNDQIRERLWILRYQAGDEDALESLVQQYQAPLRYYLRRLMGNEHQAEDILQDVWMTMIRELKRLRDPKSFSVWLYRIARNRAFRFLRRQGRLPQVSLKEEDNLPREDTPEFTAEDAAAIHAALDKLSLDHREILVLRFFEDMSYEQLASLIGCNHGTVRSRLHYAKKMLRKQIEEQSHDQ